MLFKLLRNSIKSLMMDRQISQTKPLVVVFGATGAGKSKLALEVAAKVDGEIISADAMQIYKGLDIVTNKVTPEEMRICPHHMIGFLSPSKKYTAVDFRNDVLPIIADIHERGKVPVIAGGTNYYIEGILWDFLISSKGSMDSDSQLRAELELKESTELHEMLSKVDVETALKLHPNDKRKIIRALEVYETTNVKLSDHHAQQKKRKGSSEFGGLLRFPNSCLFWVQCQPEILLKRVYKRVDKMIDAGLLKELSEFHEAYNKNRLSDDTQHASYEDGIFQSIGFKEFHDYLTSGTDDEKLFAEAVERMKLSTWQYAKYQQKWISKRIVNRTNALPVYAVDGSFPELWDEKVLNPAIRILSKNFPFLSLTAVSALTKEDKVSETVSMEPLVQKPADPEKSFELMICDICNGRRIPKHDWEAHLSSRKHRNNLKRIERLKLDDKGHDQPSKIKNHEETILCDVCNGRSIPNSDWDNHRLSKRHRKLMKKNSSKCLTSLS